MLGRKKMIDIDAYMKETKEELEAGIYADDYDMFLMLEQLYDENKNLNEIIQARNEAIDKLQEDKGELEDALNKAYSSESPVRD